MPHWMYDHATQADYAEPPTTQDARPVCLDCLSNDPEPPRVFHWDRCAGCDRLSLTLLVDSQLTAIPAPQTTETTDAEAQNTPGAHEETGVSVLSVHESRRERNDRTDNGRLTASVNKSPD